MRVQMIFQSHLLEEKKRKMRKNENERERYERKIDKCGRDTKERERRDKEKNERCTDQFQVLFMECFLYPF